MTEKFEELPKIVKVLLIIFFGWIIGGVYRIIKWAEAPEDKKNTLTLVAGILALLTGIGNFIIEICDIVTEITSNRITVLAD